MISNPEPSRALVVAKPDAVVDPRAVMVHLEDTAPAILNPKPETQNPKSIILNPKP